MATEPNKNVLLHVTQYFINAFPNSPPQAFQPDLPIRKAFKANTWKALADTFNGMAWMQQMDKSITQTQMKDPKIKTIGDVALLITNTAGHAVRRLTGSEFPRARRLTIDEAIRRTRR
jgi:hypothetical protein